MRIVIDLLSDTEWHFDDEVSAEHALAQVYCEKQGLLSWYYGHAPNFEPAHKMLDFRYGKTTVGLGDYATKSNG